MASLVLLPTMGPVSILSLRPLHQKPQAVGDALDIVSHVLPPLLFFLGLFLGRFRTAFDVGLVLGPIGVLYPESDKEFLSFVWFVNALRCRIVSASRPSRLSLTCAFSITQPAILNHMCALGRMACRSLAARAAAIVSLCKTRGSSFLTPIQITSVWTLAGSTIYAEHPSTYPGVMNMTTGLRRMHILSTGQYNMNIWTWQVTTFADVLTMNECYHCQAIP
ncbi:hypothetical protein ACRALDRAFT_206501 [Sodiomyces alcalophilus JCM 7366]|uniref:uncharacterized protein n=1 Tax=Sodiomyces alcalophilus JCM 7366 TaxID=591952 RepID=UPI0039B55AEC